MSLRISAWIYSPEPGIPAVTGSRDRRDRPTIVTTTMISPKAHSVRVDGIAPVITLAAHRPHRPSALAIGLRSLGLALLLGAGVAASVVAFGFLATTAARHLAVALPVIVVVATLAAWPAMARRVHEASEPVPDFPPDLRSRDEVRGRVLHHPAGRRITRG